MSNELARAFQLVIPWCQEYLELQQSADVGREAGQLLRALRDIAVCPDDFVGDRFDRLKALERDVSDALADLAVAYAESLKTKQLHRSRPRSQPETGRTTLFVYGTLKRGFCRSYVLDGQEFLGPARTVPRYRLHRGDDYPCLVEAEPGATIAGELWSVDAACLARLDDVEGVDLNLFTRGPIELLPPFDAEPVEAYFFRRCVQGLADCGNSWHG